MRLFWRLSSLFCFVLFIRNSNLLNGSHLTESWEEQKNVECKSNIYSHQLQNAMNTCWYIYDMIYIEEKQKNKKWNWKDTHFITNPLWSHRLGMSWRCGGGGHMTEWKNRWGSVHLTSSYVLACVGVCYVQTFEYNTAMLNPKSVNWLLLVNLELPWTLLCSC